MRGTWQTTDGPDLGQVVAVAVPVAVVAAVVYVVLEFLTEILMVAGTVVGATLAVVVVMAVRMRRRGQLSLSPVVHWEPNAIRPVSEHPPVAARPAQALPVPQEFHLHLHGPLTPQQLAEVTAIQQAGYRAYDTYRREP